MKLASTIELNFGGVGSGRHKEGSIKDRRKEMQKVIKQHGYKFQYQSGKLGFGHSQRVYRHPTLGEGHTFVIHEKGTWTHARQGSNNSYGSSANSLGKYLSTLAKKDKSLK